MASESTAPLQVPPPDDEADSLALARPRFRILNSNSTTGTIQRAGHPPVVVPPHVWSPTFVEIIGKYDVFVNSSLQFTVDCASGGVNTIGVNYVVWISIT